MQWCREVKSQHSNLEALIHFFPCTSCLGRAGRVRGSFHGPIHSTLSLSPTLSFIWRVVCTLSPLPCSFLKLPHKLLRSIVHHLSPLLQAVSSFNFISIPFLVPLNLWIFYLCLLYGCHFFFHLALTYCCTWGFLPRARLFKLLLCLQCPTKDSQYQALHK